MTGPPVRTYFYCRKAEWWQRSACRHWRCRRAGWFPKIEFREEER